MRESVRYKALRDAKNAVEALLQGSKGTRRHVISMSITRVQALMGVEYEAMVERHNRKDQNALTLQERTGVGYRQCVAALKEAKGDIGHALEIIDYLYLRN